MEALEAENASLREQLRTLKETVPVEFLSSFATEELTDGIKIRGILLAEGLWNGVLYSWDKIKELFPRIKEQIERGNAFPMKVEHEKDPEFGKRTVGEHSKIELDPFLKAIKYEAKITDPKAIEEIKNGTFRGTSLKSQLEKVRRGNLEVANNIEPIDNSLTRTPACKVCNIFSTEELSEIKFSPGNYDPHNSEKSLKDQSTSVKSEEPSKEEEKMPDLIELTEEQVLVLPSEEELADKEGEVDLRVVTHQDALAQGLRIILKGPGKLRRRIRRKKGYYYYPQYGEYPVPYYYWYHPKKKLSEENSEDEIIPLEDIEFLEEKGEYKIIKNKKTGKWVLFVATGKEGFGAWRIKGQYDSKEEAEKAAGVEQKSQENKEPPKEKVKCPACGKEFDSPKDFQEHWDKEHKDKYGEYERYSKEKERMDQELRRKRCEFCDELVEDLEAHSKDCPVRLATVLLAVKCKFCGKEFENEEDLKKHLPNCRKYGAYKKEKYPKKEGASLSTEKEEEAPPEKREEAPRSEEKLTAKQIAKNLGDVVSILIKRERDYIEKRRGQE